ncbi:DinB family protein [Pinibacter soli]|uniref:DinB family protein n=1 Tax=Pinibacter soli TaxID=3044211 RepID=A0ABT6RDV3_9BACT|nr:DinB family protein [Pinibacter soli]MDI3320742.1 DinB family protein [Pinibacter soli]
MPTKTNVVSADFFKRYINIVKEDDAMDALENNLKSFLKLLKRIPRKKVNYAYAEGKWTIKQLLQHVIDTERVFAYRALRFSKNEGVDLPGFDENVWGYNTPVDQRKWKDMIEEFKHLRKANIAMFKAFTKEQLLLTGTANNNHINVTALGFMCAGHVQHHMGILKERYLG